MEDLGGGAPAEDLAGAMVEALLDGEQISPGVDAQIGPLGEVLAQQPVGVLVGPSLPRAGGMGEVDASAK